MSYMTSTSLLHVRTSASILQAFYKPIKPILNVQYGPHAARSSIVRVIQPH